MYHHNIIIIIESKQASIDVKHSQPFSIKHTGGLVSETRVCRDGDIVISCGSRLKWLNIT